MARKTTTVEETVPDSRPALEATPTAQPVTVMAPARSRSGLAIAGIAVGAIVATGLVFGGGVLVGTQIGGDRGGSQFPQGDDRGPLGGFPGGSNGQGGPGAGMPGQDDTQPGGQSN